MFFNVEHNDTFKILQKGTRFSHFFKLYIISGLPVNFHHWLKSKGYWHAL